MTDSLPLPPAMAQRAREFDGTPTPVRAAATVVLLRPRDAGVKSTGFELYMLRRATTMVFGGVYAFPGGGVDPAGRPTTIRTDWPGRLGLSDDRAWAVVGAAARELFEEAGVLLAGPIDGPDQTVGDVSGVDWEADRVAVAARELTMTELLDRRGLQLRDDLLLP